MKVQCAWRVMASRGDGETIQEALIAEKHGAGTTAAAAAVVSLFLIA